MIKLDYLILRKLLLDPVSDDSILIFDVVEEAKWFIHQTPKSQNNKIVAVFTFHKVKVTVSEKSSIETLVRDYNRAKDDCIVPNIGPQPQSRLSKLDRINDQIIRDAKIKLSEAPDIELAEDNHWQSHLRLWGDNPHVLAGMAFAERWARLAQLELIKYSVPGKELIARAAIDAGLPTLNFVEGREMLEDMAHFLSREWKFGEIISELLVEPAWLDDLVRRIQPQMPASLTCEGPTPRKE